MPALVVVLVAAVAIPIAGVVLSAIGNDPGDGLFTIEVVNDGNHGVTIQPCGRFFCNKLHPLYLRAGASQTWSTTGGDTAVRSFFVEDREGVVVGCLGERAKYRAGGHFVFRLSALEHCVN